jgi:hypothetical protein
MKRRDNLRRKNALLRRLHDEAAGALLVRVIGPADIVCGRQLLALVGRWLVDTKDERPLCLCCDFEWSPRGGLLPLHFVAVVPWARKQPHHTLLCGLCEPCTAHPDREARVTAALKAVWPDARTVDRPHPAPEGVQ